jgi:hypothetical protein
MPPGPGWTIRLAVREVNSGAARGEAREKVLEAARRREIDLVLVAAGPLGPNRHDRELRGDACNPHAQEVETGRAHHPNSRR